MKYRKKPIIIEAWKLTDEWIKQQHTVDPKTFEYQIDEDGNGSLTDMYIYHATNKIYFSVHKDKIDVYINTLEGDMKASIGDWIITGVNGEIYPCKPDIFEKTYEEVQ